MITLRDSIEIKTTPEKIFDFFVHFEENYLAWHPDHVKSYWIGKPAKEGSILYCEEYLHGKLHRMKFRITKVELNRKIEYKLLEAGKKHMKEEGENLKRLLEG